MAKRRLKSGEYVHVTGRPLAPNGSTVDKRNVREKLLAGTHRMQIDRYEAKLVKLTNPVDTTGGHRQKDLDAVCQALCDGDWEHEPYWYVLMVREKAVRVLDWIKARDFL